MEIIIPNNFDLIFRDRFDHDRLLIMVFWKDIVLCELNKERGDGEEEMKIYCNDVLYNDKEIVFPFDDFLKVMSIARERLKSL